MLGKYYGNFSIFFYIMCPISTIRSYSSTRLIDSLFVCLLYICYLWSIFCIFDPYPFPDYTIVLRNVHFTMLYRFHTAAMLYFDKQMSSCKNYMYNTRYNNYMRCKTRYLLAGGQICPDMTVGRTVYGSHLLRIDIQYIDRIFHSFLYLTSYSNEMFKQVRKFVFICIVCFVVCSAASKANGNSKNKSKRKEMKIETLKKVECADDKSAQLGSVVHFHYKLSVEGHPDIIEST